MRCIEALAFKWCWRDVIHGRDVKKITAVINVAIRDEYGCRRRMMFQLRLLRVGRQLPSSNYGGVTRRSRRRLSRR